MKKATNDIGNPANDHAKSGQKPLPLHKYLRGSWFMPLEKDVEKELGPVGHRSQFDTDFRHPKPIITISQFSPILTNRKKDPPHLNKTINTGDKCLPFQEVRNLEEIPIAMETQVHPVSKPQYTIVCNLLSKPRVEQPLGELPDFPYSPTVSLVLEMPNHPRPNDMLLDSNVANKRAI
ncbi:hypothetical protein Ancab_014862 [Ancistrocladus abbreviatus]